MTQSLLLASMHNALKKLRKKNYTYNFKFSVLLLYYYSRLVANRVVLI